MITCPFCEADKQAVVERDAKMRYYGRDLEYRRRYVMCPTCGLEYLRASELAFNSLNSRRAIEAAGFPVEL